MLLHGRQVIRPALPCSHFWDLLTCTLPTGLALLCCTGEPQGLFSRLRARDSFSALKTSGLALPPARGSEKCRAHLQLATDTICDEGWGQVSRDLIPGTGFSVLNLLCCPDKVQGPLSPVLETVKKKFSSLACSMWQGQAGRSSQAHHHSVDEGSSYLEAI